MNDFKLNMFSVPEVLHFKPNIQVHNHKSWLPHKGISDTHIKGCHIFSGESDNSTALCFGNITHSQDGTQLEGCFLLQRQHPGLTDHVASPLPWPGSRLFPSVRHAAPDINGSCHNHSVMLLGTTPIFLPTIAHSLLEGSENSTENKEHSQAAVMVRDTLATPSRCPRLSGLKGNAFDYIFFS